MWWGWGWGLPWQWSLGHPPCLSPWLEPPTPQPGGENCFPLMMTLEGGGEMLFSVFPRLLQLRFIAATLGWWYICETQSETLISRLNWDGGWWWGGFPRNLQNGHFPSSHFPPNSSHPSHFPTHTRALSHPLSLSFCSSSPHRDLQLRGGEEMLKCQSDSENFLEKKLSLPSAPEQASLPPPFHSRHNFWNIFTKISRQCNLKTSFVELLKCKFKSPFLFNIGIWFDQWLMGSLVCGPNIWIENWGSY